MNNPRLLVPRRLATGDSVTVEGQPAHHVTHVLRMRSGGEIRVFDGMGREHHAILTDIGRGNITLEIGAVIPGDRESTLRILLAQGIARHDRMDMIFQKAVELGVQTIQPLWLQRSQNFVKGERLQKRLQHWQGVIASACEQCGCNTLPQLLPPAGLSEWLGLLSMESLKLLLQPDSSKTLTSLARPAGEIILLVGPEGGLNKDEQSIALAGGFIGLRLGPRILRTETAALAAIAGLQTLWGDFN